MTSEGVFPKVDGDVLYASEANSFNYGDGIFFKNYAQLLFNSAYIGFSSNLNNASGSPNLKNIKYDVFNNDTATTKTGWTYDSINKYYYTITGQSSNSLIFQTTGLDTINNVIATWNSSIDINNTLTVSISADGINYEEVTDANIHKFTNTGTNLYVKFEINRVNTNAVDKISEYAIWYNTGKQ